MALPLTVEGILARRAAPVERALAAYLHSELGSVRSPGLAAPARHVVDAGGKRLRPALTLLACEAVGGEAARALTVACGVELLHNFTLVHDDIMDGALVRRHRPTVEARWGAETAVLTGDVLFAAAFRAFSDAARAPGVAPELGLRVMREASATSLRLARGQAMDLSFAARARVSVEEGTTMVRLKTGALLAFALRAGALLGGGGDAVVDALGRFGDRVGEAFQLRDDLLDLLGDPSLTGKPRGADVRGGKRTLLVAKAMEELPPTRVARLQEILDAPAGSTTDDLVAEATTILREAGALKWANRRMGMLHREAMSDLDAVAAAVGGAGAAPALAELRAIANFVVAREL